VSKRPGTKRAAKSTAKPKESKPKATKAKAAKPKAAKSRKSGPGAPGRRARAGAQGGVEIRRGPALDGKPSDPSVALCQRARRVAERLAEARPQARVELEHSSALELLVATILAAQCTDERVNQVTKRLFVKYPIPEAYLAAPLEELEEAIRETGFFRQKARSLRGVMEALGRDFDGQVPGDMASLTSLPGVGRKTANVVLAHCFDTPGLVVDTHVTRVAARLGLIEAKLAERKLADRIETALCDLLPEASWSDFGTRMVLHGRYTCRARAPQCDECALMDLCPHFREVIAPARK